MLCPSASRGLDLLVTASGSGHQESLLRPVGEGVVGELLQVRRDRRRRLRTRCVQAAVVAGDGLLDVFGEVVPQVPPVGDLNGLRGADAGAFGVGAGPVPADDLHAAVLSEPGGKGAGFPVGQDVDRPTGIDVDQHRRIPVASAQSEVIHAQGGDRSDRWIRQGPDQPQDGASADHQAESVSQPGACPTRQRQPDLLQRLTQQRAAPSISAGQPGDLLGERVNRAARRVAEESTDPQPDLHRLTRHRRVAEPTLVAAVHPASPATTTSTPGAASTRTSPNPQARPLPFHSLDHDRCQMRQERNKISRSHEALYTVD